ncbi:sensor histidine kinase [Clostridiaceae bacterium M8S5]|nr:sensor histidine kinase [Clostridiaceae bacterium M8S5]
MQNDILTANRIHSILGNALNTIAEGKKEIFEIAESVRKECDIVNSKLVLLKSKIETIINELDILELEEKKARFELMRVSKNFNEFNEEHIKNAYENANNFRINLVLKRQEEKDLINRRNELEIRYRNLAKTLEKADGLGSKICTAIDYLNGNLEEIIDSIEDMDRKKYYGVKIIKAQERERKKIAREIHDGPAQSMANIVLKAELCEKLLYKDPNRAKDELGSLKSVVRGCLTDVRRIIYDLRPMSLDDLGLIPTIEKLKNRFSEETGIDVKFKILGEHEYINSIVQLSIFRVIQEALSNIIKHSKARNVEIILEYVNGCLNVAVKDDGIGFDIEHTGNEEDSNSGFGMLGMKERVELLSGQIKVESVPYKGTTISVSIPYLGKDEH